MHKAGVSSPARRTLGSFLALLAVGLLTPTGASADDVRATMNCNPAPLLQAGKTQLLERVLTRPGASLATAPGQAGKRAVPAFSVLFVYGRSPDGKALQVGARSDCKPEGWIATETAVTWKHSIVAAFAPRTSRERALFFSEEQALRQIVAAKDAGEQASTLRGSAGAAGSGPLAAVEPENAVDMREQFYLLPILEAGSARFASQKKVRVLKVAAVSTAAKPPTPPAGGQDFRAAVVFVVDASASMQPYINRTREAINRIYGKIEGAKLEDKVRFGMVGYRDDPKTTPGVEYLTRVFVDPNKVASREAFNKAAAGLSASKASTRAVAEDGYAGIDAALKDVNWDGFSARFIVLVTDASSRDPESGLSATGLTASRLSVIAQEHGTALFALHLLSAGNEKDHEKGKTQYEELAQFPGCSSLYYPVPTGDVGEFGKRIDLLGDRLTDLVTVHDAPPAPSAGTPTTPTCSVQRQAGAEAATSIAADVDAIAHAMRLAYLGKVSGSTAPAMFDAWTADRDFANQAIATYDIRVLLTKTQLADLESTVHALSNAYRDSKIDPSALFAQLRSAAATLARDPAKIGTTDHAELSKAILGEYLDGLPYASRIMAIDQDTWKGMSPGEQQAFIDDLDVMSAQYKRFHDDVGLWVMLAEGGSANDAVYPIPIKALP